MVYPYLCMDQESVERLLKAGRDNALMFDVVNFDGCDYALISGVGDFGKVYLLRSVCLPGIAVGVKRAREAQDLSL